VPGRLLSGSALAGPLTDEAQCSCWGGGDGQMNTDACGHIDYNKHLETQTDGGNRLTDIKTYR